MEWLFMRVCVAYHPTLVIISRIKVLTISQENYSKINGYNFCSIFFSDVDIIILGSEKFIQRILRNFFVSCLRTRKTFYEECLQNIYLSFGDEK